MGHSLTPLPPHVADSLATACSSNSNLPQPFCWIYSGRDAAGELHFKALECKSRLSYKQYCRSNQIALNPCRKRSSRLQAWPNVSCSVAFTSDSTTLPSKPELARSSASRNFLLQEATELALPNAPEGKGEGDAPLEGDPGKIFVGNLPYHVKREAVKEYFSQCGPVSDIIFIRSHSDPVKNKGYCFLFFGSPYPHAAAIRAADLDGA